MAETIQYSNGNSDKLEKGRLGIHPLKFTLYGGIISMFMFFALTTSALLFSKGDTLRWVNFKLPNVFLVSTGIVILSSICMHYSMRLYKAAEFVKFRMFLAISIILGLAFLGSQLIGVNVLKQMGFPLSGMPSGSFIYVLAIAHGLHIVFGLLFSIITLAKAHLNRKDPIYELRDVINPRRVLSLELLTIFWHFIDGLWVYLYIFLYFNYQ